MGTHHTADQNDPGASIIVFITRPRRPHAVAMVTVGQIDKGPTYLLIAHDKLQHSLPPRCLTFSSCAHSGCVSSTRASFAQVTLETHSTARTRRTSNKTASAGGATAPTARPHAMSDRRACGSVKGAPSAAPSATDSRPTQTRTTDAIRVCCRPTMIRNTARTTEA
jgi:hypothetical protein